MLNKWLVVIAFSVLLLVPVGAQNAFASHTFPTINTVGPTVGVLATTFTLGDPGGIFVDCIFTSAGAATISILRDSPRVQLDVVNIATVGAGSESTTFVITDTATFTVDRYLIGCAFQETGADHNDSVSHFFDIVVPVRVVGANIGVDAEYITPDTTALLLAGVQTNLAWIIPVSLSAVGIGVFVARRKHA